jgi:hypothetical protein
MGRLQASETLARAAIVATFLCAVMAAGCGAEKFSPRAAWQDSAGSVDPFSPDRFGDLAWRRFAGQFSRNRSLPPELLSRVVVLIMLPRYSPVEQIRHGNMGHVAIEIDHRLYDMGALNGYAYVFRPAPAIRFWDFPTADAALKAVKDHPDCDGHLDRIIRFDVTVSTIQAARLRDWWARWNNGCWPIRTTGCTCGRIGSVPAAWRAACARPV